MQWLNNFPWVNYQEFIRHHRLIYYSDTTLHNISNLRNIQAKIYSHENRTLAKCLVAARVQGCMANDPSERKRAPCWNVAHVCKCAHMHTYAWVWGGCGGGCGEGGSSLVGFALEHGTVSCGPNLNVGVKRASLRHFGSKVKLSWTEKPHRY